MFIVFEFIAYMAILACIFVGAVFSNLISPAPLVRSTVIITLFVVAIGIVIGEFNNYVVGAISAVSGMGVVSKSLISAAAVLVFALVSRQIDKAVSWILPNDQGSAST